MDGPKDNVKGSFMGQWQCKGCSQIADQKAVSKLYGSFVKRPLSVLP